MEHAEAAGGVTHVGNRAGGPHLYVFDMWAVCACVCHTHWMCRITGVVSIECVDVQYNIMHVVDTGDVDGECVEDGIWHMYNRICLCDAISRCQVLSSVLIVHTVVQYTLPVYEASIVSLTTNGTVYACIYIYTRLPS